MPTRITVPLDASGIERLDPTQAIKILVAAGDKLLTSQTITFEKNQRAEVTLGVEGPPLASRTSRTATSVSGASR